MNDYEDELLGGTLPELTPEQEAALAAEQEGYQSQIDLLSEPEVSAQSGMLKPEATAPAPEAPAQQQDFFSPQAFAERAFTAQVGLSDAVLDALNLIPNVDIPKVPKF